MYLNSLKPAKGSRQSIQARRSGHWLGFAARLRDVATRVRNRVPVAVCASGFEGGQMPLQMRLPKFGFTARKIAFFGAGASQRNRELAVSTTITPERPGGSKPGAAADSPGEDLSVG